ncbi:hypothetical protein HGRIS_011851 [Hohenbuehelia grisea]|uniref:Uncharacterized protein n=1 Tax=Hohenbuehelia grisea TaxID=104357 RepID=A0ABR3JXC4_9AGAR
MPEYPELLAMGDIVRNSKGQAHWPTKQNKQPHFHLEIHPPVFAVDRTACSVDRTEYTGPSLTAIPNSSEDPSNRKLRPQYYERAQGASWAYLLNDQEGAPGQLYCAVRGKHMAIAAGHHLTVIHFGLEGHIVPMATSVYQEITGGGLIQSEHKDDEKARLMWSFAAPDSCREKNAKKPLEKINLLAVFVSDTHAWAVVDFSRLTRIHAISRDKIWTAEDLQPGSEAWPKIWSHFGGGPDWVVEADVIDEYLVQWRHGILRYYGHSHLITSFFSHEAGSTASTTPVEQFRAKRSVIITFASEFVKLPGVGRHIMTDFCGIFGVFPGEPLINWLRDKIKAQQLFDALKAFMRDFAKPRTLKRISRVQHSSNPFAYNATVDGCYKSLCCNVFRRTVAHIKLGQYNAMLVAGLFDPSHTIGQPYTKTCTLLKGKPTQRVWKRVYFRDGVLRVYTIIRAQAPLLPGWVDGPEKAVTKDISLFSLATDIGTASYHENLAGRIDPEKVQCKGPGRKKTIITGQAGRRSKEPTKAQLAAQAKREINGARQTIYEQLRRDETTEVASQEDSPSLESFEADGEYDDREVPFVSFSADDASLVRATQQELELSAPSSMETDPEPNAEPNTIGEEVEMAVASDMLRLDTDMSKAGRGQKRKRRNSEEGTMADNKVSILINYVLSER